MKRARSWQYFWRLTKWRDLYLDLARQPFITLEWEVDIEEAKRLFGHVAPPGVIAVQIGYTVYKPLEVEVTP
jgi:hypothetical protein